MRYARHDGVAVLVAITAICLAFPNLVMAQDAPATPAEPTDAPQTTEPRAAETPAPPMPLPEDGPAYSITRFELRYLREHPAHPSVESLLRLEVPLLETPEGFVAPRTGQPFVRLPISALGSAAGGQSVFFASALQRILESLRDHLVNQHQLMGVFIAPDPLQITETGEDLREGEQQPLAIVITTGTITELRTLGSGERVQEHGRWRGTIDPDARINNPAHQRIRDRSPIRPYGQGEMTRNDLLRKDELDRYLFHLSRHPGRRVDASVAMAEDQPGGVALDYVITENPPLVLYAQISNTGTRSTDYWRQRFGFFHSQFTNNDDVLSFDYITSWFDETNAVLGAYEAPFENDRFRWRLHGNWSEFTADQIGFFDDEFEGESWAAGGELIANIHQHRELFIDVLGGARFQNIHVDNRAFAIEGDEDFIIPHVGVRMDRTTEWFSTQASGTLEYWLTNADETELAALGRTDPDADTPIFQWSLSHAVYLEPVFNRAAWENPATPEDSTLAHELFLSARGQFAFGNRLIPQAEMVAGGLYTVRGYPESVVAGDNVIMGTVEYRFHLPRALGIESEPRELFGRPFRLAPQYVYGRPDWDLVLKAFLDAARTDHNDRLSFENDETLIGAGVGIEVLYRRNINLRLDWGFALDEVGDGQVNEGSNRVHFVATILF